jgi:hypothetical protein
MKNKSNRRTARLDLRLEPWPAYALRAYAQTYDKTLAFAATEAIKCLIFDVPRKTMKKWLSDFREINALD